MEDGIHPVRLLFLALVPLGKRWYARDRWHFRGKPIRVPQHAQAYRGMLHRANKHQVWLVEWRAARSSTSQGSAEPLRVRTKGANRAVSEEMLISDHSMFSSYKRRTGKILRVLSRDAQSFGRLDAGSRANFTGSSPPPREVTWVFQFSLLLLHDVWP